MDQDLLKLAKAELLRSQADKKHPFRYFQLATLSEFPEVRTLVLRAVAPDLSLTCFTDIRSPKVAQIHANDRVSAHFYHPRKKLQVRMKGRAEVLESGESFEAYFRQIEQAGHTRDYTSAAPPGSLFDDLAGMRRNEEIHFGLIRMKPTFLDILQLNTTTHVRQGYTLQGDRWEARQLVP